MANSSNNHIAMLLLAAGSSSRMPSVKQLLPWNNSTLLGSAIKTSINSDVSSVYVVLGANYKPIRHKVKNENAHFMYHKNWEEGMGSSIAFGLKNILKNNTKTNAVLIALTDQPLVDVNYINKLITIYITSIKNIISSNYGTHIGVPAIFDSVYFSDLLKLRTDSGAKQLLKKFKEDVFVMDISEKLEDIDTLDEYNRMYNKMHGAL